MKMRAILTTVALMLFTGTAANAQDAGCGLGSMVIKEQTKLMQIFAATTNGSTGSQLFGITSGTSGCKSENFVMREKAAQYFAEVNKEDLSREMAQGRGEKLMTLAAIYGCEGEAQASFAVMTQENYSKIVPTPLTTADEMVTNIGREMSSNMSLAKDCRIL
jgi:hypothetical protein